MPRIMKNIMSGQTSTTSRKDGEIPAHKATPAPVRIANPQIEYLSLHMTTSRPSTAGAFRLTPDLHSTLTLYRGESPHTGRPMVPPVLSARAGRPAPRRVLGRPVLGTGTAPSTATSTAQEVSHNSWTFCRKGRTLT